jgi:hypothetical protein
MRKRPRHIGSKLWVDFDELITLVVPGGLTALLHNMSCGHGTQKIAD